MLNRCIIYVTDHKSAFTVWGRRNGRVPGTIKFVYVITNIGGHCDTSTGKFNCQYPGIYVFSLHILKVGGYDQAQCSIRKNGSSRVWVKSDPDDSSDGGWYGSSNTVVYHLVSGDVVDLASCTDADSMDYGRKKKFRLLTES